MTSSDVTGSFARSLEADVRDWVLQGFKPQYGQLAGQAVSQPRWRAVRAAGTELWLDTGDIDGIAAVFEVEFQPRCEPLVIFRQQDFHWPGPRELISAPGRAPSPRAVAARYPPA